MDRRGAKIFTAGAAWALLALSGFFAGPARAGETYQVKHTSWTVADERGYGEFIAAIGRSGCRTVDACLHDGANPFRASDPPGRVFRSDCADLPYVLRFYYAWKQALPFSYVSDVSPRGRTRDIRYTAKGNRVAARRDVKSGADAMAVIATLRGAISSASYRIHPDLEEPEDDFYSPALSPGSIRPGTVIYDPNGHLAIVWNVESDGRIRYIDAHPDNSLTRGYYDERFVRASPGMGAGFKNWRPLTLVGARRSGDVLVGGTMVLAGNAQIAAFSDAQFFGNGPRPADGDWREGRFILNGAAMDYYDYVRARMAGGALSFDPVREVADMVRSNCDDLHYRVDAINAGLAAGLAERAEPARLPLNIYGSEGDWEDYSTPSRDARLKTAFKQLRDQVGRFLEMGRTHDPRLAYRGSNLAGDMLAAYDGAAAQCHLTYIRSDGSAVTLSYEDARQRLFRLSFDPYQCVERRWGAGTDELSTCHDGALKRAWYDAEQSLRNQTDRIYEARMGWSLDELKAGSRDGGRIGVATPPNTDARGYLLSQGHA